MKNTLADINSIYAVEEISKDGKKNYLKGFGIAMIWAFLVLAVGIVAATIGQNYIWVLVLGALVALVCGFIGKRELKKIFLNFDARKSHGEISDVLKEVTTKRSITGGYGMYVTRKYDAFAKEAVRITLSISDGKNVHQYVLDGASEAHLKYYEAKGEAIHIPFTRFPVKLSLEDERWLCPVCGEFNGSLEKNCRACHKKILK